MPDSIDETRSVLHDEIQEQPEVLRRLFSREGANIARIGADLGSRGLRFVLIAARGTSDNAARYAQYAFGIENRLVVALAVPSLFGVYQRPPDLAGSLVIGISQSGQSPDVVGVLAEAARQGAPTVAITNEPDSPLAQAASHVIALHAGEERSVAATKTYTSQLLAMWLFSRALAGKEPGRDETKTADAVERVAQAMTQALHVEDAARQAASAFGGPPSGGAASGRCAVVSRGYNFATAHEIALKIKELAYVAAEPFSSADFQHGPIAMVEPGFPVIVVAVGNIVRDEIGNLLTTLRTKAARLIVLSDAGSSDGLLEREDLWIPVPAGLPEDLTPFAAIVPGQLLAYHLALSRGNNPDRPRTIHKVTRTV